MESPDYPDGLRAQYREASELIAALSTEFLDGDRSRVIIVPGNHDVDWNGVRKAFDPVDEDTGNPRSIISDPETHFRWSWSNRQMFRIVDMDRYRNRFQFFSEMHREFYKDSTLLAHPLNPGKPWNLFELDGGNILVCAFNSCVINDCFSDLGHISSTTLAECHLEMRRVGKHGCLPIAVWHHGVGGSPLTSDYIDPSTVKLMVDKGFRLGLHGHWHDSSLSPVDLFVSTIEKMAVIGAGSLSAGQQAPPHGVNRRYNVIQIDLEHRNGCVHVREMNQPNIWGPGQLFESGGKFHVSIDWTDSSLEMVDQARSGGSLIKKVDELEGLINSGRLDEARARLLADDSPPGPYRRQLLAKVLEQDEAWSDLKNLLANPQNDAELALFVAAAERGKDLHGVAEILEAAEESGGFSGELVNSLRQRVQARLSLGEVREW